MFSGLLAAAASAGIILSGPVPVSAAATDPAQLWVVDHTSHRIKNPAGNGCLTGAAPGYPTRLLGCTGVPPQIFVFEATIEDVSGILCLSSAGAFAPTTMLRCSGSPTQAFVFHSATKTIRNRATGLCLTTTGLDQPTVMSICAS
ncbi:ricin-type beta-trefoil lectin domain protein [Nonomuraea sp. LPB2021202275-12-8]|uniref:ricin-type beta-trefoil lectin domain protein n=1 Tax=Nonomuraea sp. LPB2021202275-12-8 TaxID=3120159 RepID=UPI00300C3259